MPSANAHLLRHTQFDEGVRTFDVHAFVEPTNPNMFQVEITLNGQRVVIAYPDGFKASLHYSVEALTRLDLQMTRGVEPSRT